MKEYVSDPNYETSEEKAGLCFFVEIVQDGSKYEAKLYFDD